MKNNDIQKIIFIRSLIYCVLLKLVKMYVSKMIIDDLYDKIKMCNGLQGSFSWSFALIG